MRFSEQWLRSWVNPSLDTEALSHLLTMAGLEVEDVSRVAPPFSSVVVGEVKEVVKHENADRLRVTHVDIGTGECVQIVCGASNVAPGIKVPCALPGAVLPGNITIKPTKMRGVQSNGMLCSGKELGIPDEADGLLILPDSSVPGQSLRDVLMLDDHVFTIKVTPNRADCLSIRGIAREVAALTSNPWSPVASAPVTPLHTQCLSVTNEVGPACGRYIGRIVRNIHACAKTPEWMKRRLERSGIRSVSAVVDITNYVLLEHGQPMHAFDLAAIEGGITVRMAHRGETLQCLNEKLVQLDPSLMVIADERKVLAIAGVMGGMTSRVTEQSRDLFLESAFFAPESVAGKARQLGFGSDSSYRYERGVDFQGQREAMERATQLILDVCGGEAGPITEVVDDLPARNAITLRSHRVNQVLGITLSAARIRECLHSLHLPVAPQGDGFTVVPPSFRYDLRIEEDLIEEVARVHGYEAIPAEIMPSRMRMLPLPEQRHPRATIRRKIAARDYQEVITYAFVAEEWERDFVANHDPIRLLNPIAAPMSVMRSSLIGGLVNVLVANLNRKQPRVRVFELARVFQRDKEGNDQQPEILAGLAWGARWLEQWGEPASRLDFYDVKSDIEALLYPRHAEYRKAEHPAFHPGRCAQLYLEEKAIGIVGELHPKWVQHYELGVAPIVFELDMAQLECAERVVARRMSKMPLVRRDLALVVEDNIEVGILINSLRYSSVPFVVEVAVFDVYRGQGIEAGKKSIALRVLLQDKERTLTDEEVESSIQQLLDRAWRCHGAVRRGNES